MRFYTSLIAILMCLWAVPASAAMYWQAIPHKIDMMHIRDASNSFRLVDGDGATVSLMRPDLTKAPIGTDAAGLVTIKPDCMEYFHVLIASRDEANTTMTAIRYFHFFGRPSPVSPSVLVNTAKSDLDIVPDPLPREHWVYMADHPAQFIVRFKGHPLAAQAVNITTGNGTHLSQKTDAKGHLVLTLPDDFPITHAGRMHNEPAEMQLDATYKLNGRRYRTVLSADYSVNPAHWQSLSGGVLVAGGGLLLGGFITWRMKRKTDADGKNSRGGKQS